MKNSSTILTALAILAATFAANAQQIAAEGQYTQTKDASWEICEAIADRIADNPEEAYTPAPAPKYWDRGIVTQLGFSQVSLTNWAAGGYGSIAMNAYGKAFANYKKDEMIWENQLEVGYGFIQSFVEDGFKKSDDRFNLDSKWGYRMTEKLYLSSVFLFKTQMTHGFNYPADQEPVLVSRFFAPANVSLGVGADWKPGDWMSLNFAPLTGKIVFVSDPDLRAIYGNREDQFAKFELGAQLKIDNKFTIAKTFQIGSSLTLFSDYLHKPQNVDVYWDVSLTGQLTKHLAFTVRTNLIYDDDIKFLDRKDSAGNPIPGADKIPGLQFKEAASLSFTYAFGDAK